MQSAGGAPSGGFAPSRSSPNCIRRRVRLGSSTVRKSPSLELDQTNTMGVKRSGGAARGGSRGSCRTCSRSRAAARATCPAWPSEWRREGSNAKELANARDWGLTPAAGGVSIPVDVKPTATGALEIDLSKTKASAGDYQLAATWDWAPLPVTGTLHLYPYGDFAHVALASGAHDKLIAGNGSVALELARADFEFLEKVAIESTARDAKLPEVAFTLPLGRRAGPQNSVTVNIDTAKQGSYRLLLTQSDGAAHKIPVTILPPNPKISDLPIRLNMGETREPIRLVGSGLERIEAASTDAGEITGAPDSESWSGEIRLKAGITKGQSFPLVLKIKSLDNPVTVPHAIEIVGPRPKIRSVQKSLAGTLEIELGADELPAGTAAGLALAVDHLYDSTHPRLELGCEAGELRKSLTLSAGESSGGASLTSAGPGALFLSVDRS